MQPMQRMQRVVIVGVAGAGKMPAPRPIGIEAPVCPAPTIELSVGSLWQFGDNEVTPGLGR